MLRIFIARPRHVHRFRLLFRLMQVALRWANGQAHLERAAGF
jgi:hypothetical protein